MPLAAHTRLGPYEITGSIGAGGMGEVYAAHDHRLHRDVALKVLPPLFASDPDRMARFDREAQLLASLNHARIASLYGLEESGDIRALVMELVPGPTLADRLVSGPIPVDEALIYARQIAEALEYAHERGVIHRDLKPANIKVTPDGDVKVLDFGLAKALDTTRVAAALADSPTLTIASTGAGVIMGTAAYMSPEQAAGGTVDRRSDVFSFGSVLFEMLAGHSAFGGGSATEVLAAVLKSEPDWNALPATTPGVVRSLLQRCLTKDRKQRLQAIGEARIVLEAPRDAASEPRARRIAAPTLAWTIAGLSLVVAGVLLWERFTPAPQAPRVVTRFGVPFDTSGPPLPLGIAISRDGARLVFSAGAKIQLYLREFGQLDARPIPDTVGGRAPAFSPDGERLVFVGGNAELKTISLSGGGAQVITPSGVRVIAPATWDADDRILYGTSRGLMRVPVRGGMPETLVPIDAHLQPGETDGVVLGAKMLRDGRGVLYNVGKSSGKLEAAVLDVSTGRHTRLNSVNGFIVGVTAGQLLFNDVSTGDLMAIPFDEQRFDVTASPIRVLEGNFGQGGLVRNFTLSDSGTVSYYSADERTLAKNQLVWVDRGGKEQPISDPIGRYYSVQFSPDGNQLAMMLVGERGQDVWTYRLPGGPLQRRTFDRSIFAFWTPDGSRLVVRSPNEGQGSRLVSIPADGSGKPVILVNAANLPTAITPDGKTMIGAAGPDGRQVWLWPVTGSPLAGDAHENYPNGLMEPPSRKNGFQFSNDGRWVAYASDESGRSEIFVVPYPGPGAKTQVSINGGHTPRWSRDGRELFFIEGTRVMAVRVETQPAFRVVSTPAMLFDYPGYLDTAGYDVSRDGQRFVMARNAPIPPGQLQVGQIQVVVNWVDELRRVTASTR